MRSIVLSIDTSSNQEVMVGLEVDKENDVVKQSLGKQKAQVVLPLIAQLLDKHQLQPNDLTAIMVNQGPGSFVGLRVGVSIANTLASFLRIPVNGKDVGDLVEPNY